MQNILKQPFSNVQLELLKTFSHQLSEKDLLELKNTIAHFFSKKLIQNADEIWENQNWDDKKVDELLQTKMRKK